MSSSQNAKDLLAQRVRAIKPSPTLAVTQTALALKKKGIDIISLGAGEPDFDTPDNIKKAAIEAIKSGATKYTDVGGMLELKTAVQNKFLRENNLKYDLEQIIISNGGKQVIYNLFMASLNDGDEVIIPTPYWVSYPDIVELSSGKSVLVPTTSTQRFCLQPEQLANLISNKTKWLILNSPSNPTGSSYYADDLVKIAEVLREYPHVQILSDDIYEHITYDNFKFTNLAQVAPDLKERIFIVNGVSKAYSMTGWRIGYGAGDARLIKAMTTLQSQSTSNPCSISQVAAIEALSGTQEFISKNAQNFVKKRDLVLGILQQEPRIECYRPQGAFYLFPSCYQFFGKKDKNGQVINNSNDFSSYLLEEARVAVVPGIAFGAEGYFRISYATSFEQLEIAINRIVTACNKLL